MLMPHTGHEVVAAPGGSVVAATHQRQRLTNAPEADSYDNGIDNGSTDDDGGYDDEGARGELVVFLGMRALHVFADLARTRQQHACAACVRRARVCECVSGCVCGGVLP